MNVTPKSNKTSKADDLFSYLALIVLAFGAILGFMQYLKGNETVQIGGSLLLVLLLVKTAIKR